MKKCSKCRIEKFEQEFNWKITNKTRASMCKLCHSVYRREHYLANRDKYIGKAVAWSTANETKITRIEKRYSLTKTQLSELFGRFKGLCWLCKKRQATVVDHDHKCCTGKTSCGNCIRGALCINCNFALGILGDSIESLQEVLEYLNYK